MFAFEFMMGVECQLSGKRQIIKQSIDNKWQVCCYGLGHMGRKLCDEIPSIFHLKIDLFCDRDDERVRKFVTEDADPIYLNDLLSIEKDILVFVLVDDPYDVEIVDNLSVNPHLHMITLRELLDMEEVIKHYFGDELFELYSKLEVQKGL